MPLPLRLSRFVLVPTACFAAGCSSDITGKAPKLADPSPDLAVLPVAPGVVCRDQLTTQVAVTGDGFSPLPGTAPRSPPGNAPLSPSRPLRSQKTANANRSSPLRLAPRISTPPIPKRAPSSFKLSVFLPAILPATLLIRSVAFAESPVSVEFPTKEPPPEIVAPQEAPADEPIGLVVGLKVGGAFSSVFNTFGSAFTPELELGFRLPRLDRAFEVFTNLRYAAPTSTGEVPADPRLPGDQFPHWTATRSELSIGLGLRFCLELDPVTPYIAAGGRLYLLDTKVSGDVADTAFGTNHEIGRTSGFLFALGGEYAIGPGRILLELGLNGAPLDKTVLADTNTSSLDTDLGYRFFF